MGIQHLFGVPGDFNLSYKLKQTHNSNLLEIVMN